MVDNDEPEVENVRVVVRIRPLNPLEIENQARVVAYKAENEPHITLGERHQFTFDDVFSVTSTQEQLFSLCVQELVDKSIEGNNATVLAYGQASIVFMRPFSNEYFFMECSSRYYPYSLDHKYFSNT